MSTPYSIKGNVRSTRTIANYVARYRYLEKSALVRNNYFGAPKWEWGDMKPHVELVIEELREFAKTSRRVNFVTYRSAVLYTITHDLLGQGFIEQDKAMELIGIVKQIKSENDASKPSAKAQSNISLRDLNKLTKALEHYSGRTIAGTGTNYWIGATLACGLRPNEWESAKIVPAQIQEHPDHHFDLHCKNSKRKTHIPPNHEPALQPNNPHNISSPFEMEALGIPRTSVERELYRLVPIYDSDLEVVQVHLEMIASSAINGESFTEYYDSCRKLLARTCERIFEGEKNYTFYTFRHQFAANAKKKYSIERVAQVMGHDSLASAPKSYASAKFAHRTNAAPISRTTHADALAPANSNGPTDTAII